MSSGTATIGLIGYGALAKQVVAALEGRAIRWVVLLREGSLAVPPVSATVVADIDVLVAERPDVVIEAAGQPSVAVYVPPLLQAGIPVIVASIGALAEEGRAGARPCAAVRCS